MPTNSSRSKRGLFSVMIFNAGDEFRFWTREECSEENGNSVKVKDMAPNTWGETGIVLEKRGALLLVRIGAIEKEIGPRAAKPVHPTEYELALEVLGEDYFA